MPYFSLYLVNVDISVYMYLMYILVSLMARYRVFCTKHVNGERSCSYACTCLVTGEMFRLSVFFNQLSFFTSEGLLCAPTVTTSSINVRRFSCELSLFWSHMATNFSKNPQL